MKAAPLAAFLLAAWTAAPAAAQPQVTAAATPTPHTKKWDDPEKEFLSVFEHLMRASEELEGGWAKFPVVPKYERRFVAVEGSVALAVWPETEVNPTKSAYVIASYGLFEVVKTRDELAFIVAHEIAHLMLGHPKEVLDERERLWKAWSDKQDWSGKTDAAAMAKRFYAFAHAPLSATARRTERQADVEGQRLMTEAGYDPSDAGSAMEHAADWLWAVQAPADPDHDPILKRAAELRRTAIAAKEAERRLSEPGAASEARKAADTAKTGGDESGLKKLYEKSAPGTGRPAGTLGAVLAAHTGGTVADAARLQAEVTAKTQGKLRARVDTAAVPRTDAYGGVPAARLEQRGYTRENMEDLETGVLRARGSVEKLHQDHPSKVADAYGDGMLARIAGAASFNYGAGRFERGSVAHQRAVLSAVPGDSSVEYRPLVVGRLAERRAVVAFPRAPPEVAQDPARLERWAEERGVVLDGSAGGKVYPDLRSWRDEHPVLDALGRARLEGGGR